MSSPPPLSTAGSATFNWGSRTYIMGIINMTPDSFSGDGLGDEVDEAMHRAQRFLREGANVIDVGGESTRPSHTVVSVEEEVHRVVPLIQKLAAALPVPVSIDTTKPEVAAAALAAGATIVNDISGLRTNPELARLAAQSGAMLILAHGHLPAGPNAMRDVPDVMRAVIEDLRWSIRVATEAGVLPAQIVVDPGFGFGKGPKENLELLRHLSGLRELGRPILVGSSRKSTIGHVLGTPPQDRVEGTAATVAIAIAHGADMVRVHDVGFMARVVRMSDAIIRGVS